MSIRVALSISRICTLERSRQFGLGLLGDTRDLDAQGIELTGHVLKVFAGVVPALLGTSAT